MNEVIARTNLASFDMQVEGVLSALSFSQAQAAEWHLCQDVPSEAVHLNSSAKDPTLTTPVLALHFAFKVPSCMFSPEDITWAPVTLV